MKDEVRRKKVDGEGKPMVSRGDAESAEAEAVKLPRQVRSQVQLGNEGKVEGEGTVAWSATAATEESKSMRTTGRSSLQETSAQRINRERKAQCAVRHAKMEEEQARKAIKRAQAPKRNPLFDLDEEERSKLFVWLRECPYDDAVQKMLLEKGIAATRIQLMNFFQIEAERHWNRRITRAAMEANALVQLAEKSRANFSSGILAALGQEAFRQIASGAVDPDAMGKLANLFMKARSDERADQMQELKREKLRHELQEQIDHALEKLAEEVDRHPVAREAFEALRKELETTMKNEEEA